jgi:regulator of protease activity HflC (stomatin/prohibitin superfamily)
MADINRRVFVRHLRAVPTAHVRHVAKGKVAHDGPGISFWFRPLNAAISEVPVDDRELPLVFHARTKDFQDVTIQAAVTFRIADPTIAATRIDFSIDTEVGRWQANPMEQIGEILTQSAQQHALTLVATMPLVQALADGVAATRDAIRSGLAADTRLEETGIVLVGARVMAIRAQADVEKALQNPTREQVQQEADRATYERRATAVQQERAIAENELDNQIQLARREEQLVAQRGQNQRREAEEQVAAGGVTVAGQADQQRTLAEAKAHATQVVGAAEAESEAAHLAPYRDLETGIVLGLALKELAGHLPEIGTLNITPDLLTPLLSRLTSGAPAPRGE